jgi:hypothetical protein
MTPIPSCRGATSVCIATPAQTYRRWPGNEPLVLCDPCATRLREMGMGIDDDRPEWIRRAAEGRLPIKDLTEGWRP